MLCGEVEQVNMSGTMDVSAMDGVIRKSLKVATFKLCALVQERAICAKKGGDDGKVRCARRERTTNL